MSAVREVKYLRELHHPNVIEVCTFSLLASTPFLLPLTPRSMSNLHKLLDVFSSKTNLNLVLEFLDTDLEMIIKERSLVFLPADIKSWMAMTFRGLEFCHRNFILHRVRTHAAPRGSPLPLILLTQISVLALLGSKAEQLAHSIRWSAQDRRLWSGSRRSGPWIQNDLSGNHTVRFAILICPLPSSALHPYTSFCSACCA
jgi:Protein kinase domain